MEPATVQRTLEIDTASEPLSGRVTDGHGERRFTGWLELFAVIDELRCALDPAERETYA